MKNTKKLQKIENDLNGIIAAITHVSSRRARRARQITQVAAGSITKAVTISGMLMYISAFGTASTGTAIGALSGAAATSAQMYWVGSFFGLGAIAGAIILPVLGAALAILAVYFISRAIFGRPRKPQKMHEFEVKALFASLRLVDPIASYLKENADKPSDDELRVYAHEGLLPLCNLIEKHLNCHKNNKTDIQCRSFKKTLALLPFWKLSRHHRRLYRHALKLAQPKRARRFRVLPRWLSRSHSNV